MHLTVRPTADFDPADAAAWTVAEWVDVPAVDGLPGHATRAAALYSAAHLYVRFDCDDDRLACSGTLADGDDLWTEDVVELFLWPDERQRLYFEYELSPLGRELALLVPNRGGAFMGWRPWHYVGDRRVRRTTTVRGGPAVTGWTATMAVPFALLVGLCDAPGPGTRWRGNLCRIDHDAGVPRLFSWAAGLTDSFHAIDRFGTFAFA